MRFGVAVTIVALGSTALADDSAKRATALTKLLEVQASWLTGSESGKDAYAKMLAADPLENLQRDLMDQAEIKLATPHVGWLGTCGWVGAESQERTHTHPEIMVEEHAPALQPPRAWHWLELVVPDGSGFKVKAITHFRTAPDSSLADGKYNDIKKLATAKSPTPLVAWLAQPAEMAKHLANDAAVTVYGTSANDHAYGPTSAKALLASWSKLQLDVVTKADDDDYKLHEIVAGECAAASARVRMKMKDGAILLEAFAIAHKTGDHWEVVAVSYAAQPQY